MVAKHSILVLLLVAVAAFGGRYAWQAYDDSRKAAAWEALLDGADCTACAARKAGIAEKQKKRRAEADAAANANANARTEAGDMSLIKALEAEEGDHDRAVGDAFGTAD